MKNALFKLLATGVVLGLFVVAGFAQQYHIVYSGVDFKGYGSSVDGYQASNGGVYATPSPAHLSCGVHFPDSANGMQVQRVSISVVDNNDSYFTVILYKKDRWTGNHSMVAFLSTFTLSKSTTEQFKNIPKSQMNAYSIDNTRYSWYLIIYFPHVGSTEYRLDQVTIRYY